MLGMFLSQQSTPILMYNVIQHCTSIIRRVSAACIGSLFFADLLATSYREYTTVFCNGSVHGGRAGGGVSSNSFKIKIKMVNNYSILTAELGAILYAIEFISKQPGKYIILTDSLSSISLLKHSDSMRNYLSNRIIDRVRALTAHNIVIEWVPSHVGINGN